MVNGLLFMEDGSYQQIGVISRVDLLIRALTEVAHQLKEEELRLLKERLSVLENEPQE